MADIRIDYEKFLINIIDRIVERAIYIRAASNVWPKKITKMHELDDEIKLFWISKLGEENFNTFKLRSMSWDLLQSDYTFERPDINYIASLGLLDIDHLINKIYITELINGFKKKYEIVHSAFPLLERIRAIDVVNEICLKMVIHDINTIRPNLKFIRNGSDIDEELYNKIIVPFFYYPEFLYPGITYRNYPRDKDTVYDFSLCIEAEAKNIDILAATEDFKFQVVRYRHFIGCYQNFNEIFSNNVSNILAKSSRDNSYILQFNSITNTLCAILAWDKIHTEGLDRQDAIRDVSSLIAVNADQTTDKEKKQVRDRLKTIEVEIDKKIKNYKDEYFILDIFGLME